MMGLKENNQGKVYRKLHSNTGETLTEMMASIVIASLSVTLLFSGIMAVAEIDRKAKESDREYYEALWAAEARKSISGESEATHMGTVTITGDSIAEKKMDIIFYGGKGMYAYELSKESTEGEPPDEGGEEILP